MVRIALVLLIILLYSCSPSVKQNSKAEMETSLENTTIEFGESSHNFGRLQAGEIVLYRFGFTNTGKHDYKINTIESDCGCVTVRHTTGAVPPGEKGWIELEFDSSGLAGREYKTIEVRGNTAESKHLVIFAEVENELIKIEY